jgi:gluconolactonase
MRHSFFAGRTFRYVVVFAALFLFTDLRTFAAASQPDARVGEIIILDASAGQLTDATAPEKIADGLSWTEGPVWYAADNALLFEDMLKNRMCRWKDGAGVEVFLPNSGDTKGTCKAYNPGSNGMAFAPDGVLYFCRQGDRDIAKMDTATRRVTVVADRYEGVRFNSPNDLVFDTKGALYFTDPPYGLVKESDSELGFSGVYRLTPDGRLTLLLKALTHPNGIAFSPDGKTLYVNDSDEKAFAVHAYPVLADGTLGKGRVFWDAMPFMKNGPGATDGMKVDERGNVWTTGPGGVYVISPEGKLLARVAIAEPCGNLVFGGTDGRTLFIMANHAVLRLPTKVRGAVR